MITQLYHLIAFLISVAVVLWTIPDVKTVGLKLGIVDRPNARKIHQNPVVRVGGGFHLRRYDDCLIDGLAFRGL